MVSERDIEHIARLADIGITRDEVAEFTPQFNAILDYFDILDQVEGGEPPAPDAINVWREDEVLPSLTQDEVLGNAGASEDGFVKAPRVM
ncbi:MAG: Asp-tRNA(Asn)/Glu-tRNA(Gln) amidotransferase subunit GatC [Methanomicrobiaceae archaeon]|uniref:Aspartyl-trna(Asn) amidotransferase subunit c n=1 Tax=hydrocarbon metagenome TaxID=938273 RepID=A0A0W8FFN0_9ZZZZ|nr:Asp-tRNA(Asn)/Glu-tRNA(Gln) amidotransferase subunit GatC [Methanomicrobiaceae archaeon]MDD5419818.1 Asp-tRNA(Asn)/Glu-tRNA(Gln) amidotransferase subunit GatC [Methanomicrobiaceae archaeon]